MASTDHAARIRRAVSSCHQRLALITVCAHNTAKAHIGLITIMLFTKLRVFVASPGDTRDERDSLADVIHELNRGIAADRCLVLELVKWETHAWPGVGTDAQDVINREIDTPDILLAIFWKRLGTPTSRAASGTVEELERSYLEWKTNRHVELLVYFKTGTVDPMREDLGQLQQVLDFRKRLFSLGVLVWDFVTTSEFRDKVREHLTQLILRWKNRDPIGPASSAATTEPKQAYLDKQFKELLAGHLSLHIDPRQQEDIARIIAVLTKALETQFAIRTRQAATTALWELLSNVARHTKGTTAKLDITIDWKYTREIRITVEDRGPGFDLNAAVVSSQDNLASGSAHGLWRLKQVTSSVSNMLFSEDKLHRVICSIYDNTRPTSLFDGLNSISHILIELGYPRVVWLNQRGYAGKGIIGDLAEGIYDASMRPLLNLYFDQLLGKNNPSYLCIEIQGDLELSDVRPSYEETLASAVEQFFKGMFLERRVILLNQGPARITRRWEELYNVPCFTDAAACKEFLLRTGIS